MDTVNHIEPIIYALYSLAPIYTACTALHLTLLVKPPMMILRSSCNTSSHITWHI
jgi:hypothetical protein